MTQETESTAPDSGATIESASGSRETMAAVSHTNPYTDESTGQLFNRGPTVAADGGRADAVESNDENRDRATDERTMKTVSHTPPTEETGTNRTNRVFERGKRRTGGVEDDR